MHYKKPLYWGSCPSSGFLSAKTPAGISFLRSSFSTLYSLLFQLYFHIPEFFLRNPVFLFESPVETGIIFKAKHKICLCNADIAEYGILAGGQPLLHNILMNGDSCIIFKNMGNMIFAGIKFPSKMFQG